MKIKVLQGFDHNKAEETKNRGKYPKIEHENNTQQMKETTSKLIEKLKTFIGVGQQILGEKKLFSKEKKHFLKGIWINCTLTYFSC